MILNDKIRPYVEETIEAAPWGNYGDSVGTSILSYVYDDSWDNERFREAFMEAKDTPAFSPWVVSEALGFTYGGFMLTDLQKAEAQGEAVQLYNVLHSAFAQYMTDVVLTELSNRSLLTVKEG